LNRFVIGVDPGLAGAVALLRDGEYAEVYDVPTMGRGKGTKLQVNVAELVTIIRSCPPCPVYFEQVGAMPKQGVSSVFAFGRTVGSIEAAFVALQFSVSYVTPPVWKRHFALIGTDKDMARTRAIQLHPGAPLGRKRDIGRADALLLATWGWRAERYSREAA
jgi:crossover junction endodeoxyribonuclease RuvC